jgi:hypothetical protein
MRYVISGGGGASLYDPRAELAQPGDLWRRAHHYVLCRVEDRRITARVFEPNGSELADLAFPLCEHR